jgi:hypothetical protein
MHWKKISPDLTLPKGQTPPAPGAAPATGAGGRGGAPAGGSIESMSASTVTAGLIWVGTNNGLIKLTRNHGVGWDDVTIPDLPGAARADISAIEASHHDAATAYVAVDCHTIGDYKPISTARAITERRGRRSSPGSPSTSRAAASRASSAPTRRGRGCCLPAPKARSTSRSMTATRGSR